MKVSYLSFFSLQTAVSHAQEACDSGCQTAFQQALASESSSWVSKNLSASEFYSTPANSTGAKPGDLLRWEDLSRGEANRNYSIPGSMSISRYLYMTEDIDRKPIPASAFVLLPYNKPDSNKPLNTLVWTHGTAGRIQNCAPSNHKDLYYEWQGPYALAQAGYAVVAPDYAGQGSDIPQGFMYEAGFLHAADVTYGLIAARKMMGKLLSEEYVVVGHSEGGMTAWRTNERLAMPDQEDLLKAGKFLGSVANAPALRPLDLIPESIWRRCVRHLSPVPCTPVPGHFPSRRLRHGLGTWSYSSHGPGLSWGWSSAVWQSHKQADVQGYQLARASLRCGLAEKIQRRRPARPCRAHVGGARHHGYPRLCEQHRSGLQQNLQCVPGFEGDVDTVSGHGSRCCRGKRNIRLSTLDSAAI
jgi:hypothetical protein